MADNDNAPVDQDEIISQFSDITGVSADRARFHLESANWTLQLALASFYDDAGAEDATPAAPRDVRMAAADDDSDDDLASLSRALRARPGLAASAAGAIATAGSSSRAAGSSSRAAASSAGGAVPKRTADRPRIATIHTLGSTATADDDEEEGQAFYAGSERSGQQILGPPRRRDDGSAPPAFGTREFVSNIFRSARESGAEVVDPRAEAAAAGAATRGRRLPTGGGYRLGQTDTDHVRLPGGDEPAAGGAQRQRQHVVVKLWRSGFSVDGGEQRRYEEPANQEFLNCVMRGTVPDELQRGSGEIMVDLEDHRNEEFRREQTARRPFSGTGHTLGSPAPVLTPTASETALLGPKPDPAADQKAADEQLAVNANEPTTMIQIRLADGSRLAGRFNHTHTVADIRAYIARARVQYGGGNFVLLTTFPSKELNDGTLTIAGAGLLNAAILQRLQ